jgi:hypothetical protein
LILFATYRDFPDTLLMFLAVPGAVAGGAIFQFLLPKLGLDISGNFSVAVWVGYIACFGLATETSIVMLVYLREAIERRGGMDRISSPEEIREAVVEGAGAPPPAQAADRRHDHPGADPHALGDRSRRRVHAPHGGAHPRWNPGR